MSEYPLHSLSIFPATREQTIESRKRTVAHWRVRLSEEEYMKRDEVMDDYEHAREKMTTWVLAPRSDPQTLDFLAACETFRRTCVSSPIAAEGEMRQAEEVISYGVASVYTPAPKRGKGYASHMMRLLHWVLAQPNYLPPSFPDQWGSPPDLVVGRGDARFSVLYSDVGGGFYSECGPDLTPGSGWTVGSVVQTTWDITPELLKATANGDSVGQWRWLSAEDVKLVWEVDADLIKKEIASLAPKDKVSFACLPDQGVASFSIDRTMRFTTDLKPILPLDIWGVQLVVAQSQGSDPTFATWTIDTQSLVPTIIVTRLRASEATFPALMSKLIEAAKNAQAQKLDIWNLAPQFQGVAHAMGGRTWERNEHLASFKWYGKESNAEVEWLFNERFCWC